MKLRKERIPSPPTRNLFAAADDELFVLDMKHRGLRAKDVQDVPFSDPRFQDAYDTFKAKLILNLLLVGDMIIEDAYLLDNPYLHRMMHDDGLHLGDLLERGWIVSATRHGLSIEDRADSIVENAGVLHSPSYVHCKLVNISRQGGDIARVPHQQLSVELDRMLEVLHGHLEHIEANLEVPETHTHRLNLQQRRTSPRYVRELLREYREAGTVSRSWMYDRLIKSRLGSSTIDRRHWLYHLVDTLYHGSIAECLATELAHPMPVPELYDECRINLANLRSLVVSPDIDPAEASVLGDPFYIDWPDHSGALMSPAMLNLLSADAIEQIRQSSPIKGWRAFLARARSGNRSPNPAEFRSDLERQLTLMTQGLYPMLREVADRSVDCTASFNRIDREFGRLTTVLNVTRHERTIAFCVDILPAVGGGLAGAFVSGAPINLALGIGGAVLSHAALNPLLRSTINRSTEKRRRKLGVNNLETVRVRPLRGSRGDMPGSILLR